MEQTVTLKAQTLTDEQMAVVTEADSVRDYAWTNISIRKQTPSFQRAFNLVEKAVRKAERMELDPASVSGLRVASDWLKHEIHQAGHPVAGL